VQLAALVVGVVFLLVGVLGFVPGITTDYGSRR
jgi:preprotein translocase subunit Sss1